MRSLLIVSNTTKYHILLSRDDTRHDDPLGERGVLPVRHHHPRLTSLSNRTKVQMEEGLALVSPLGDFHNFVPLRIVAELPLREDQLPVDLHFKSVFITLDSFNFSFWNLGQDCFRQLSCHLTVWLVLYSDAHRRRGRLRNPLRQTWSFGRGSNIREVRHAEKGLQSKG